MNKNTTSQSIFPQQVTDMLNLMHMVVFTGTDGEEKWDTFLTANQKEYIALAISEYYQCEHCIEHHLKIVSRLSKLDSMVVAQVTNSALLFFRADTKHMIPREKEHWKKNWTFFSHKAIRMTSEPTVPTLIGLAIGIAKNDDYLINFFGMLAKKEFKEAGIDLRGALGEIESVVVFMKAASTKNRANEKVGRILEENNIVGNNENELNPSMKELIKSAVREAVTESRLA
jgi:AhpD family alkylhydroperoxidase